MQTWRFSLLLQQGASHNLFWFSEVTELLAGLTIVCELTAPVKPLASEVNHSVSAAGDFAARPTRRFLTWRSIDTHRQILADRYSSAMLFPPVLMVAEKHLRA
jgi:hypothetical protein